MEMVAEAETDELDDALESALDKVVDHDEPPPRLPRQPTMPPVNVARGGAIEVAPPRRRKTTPTLGSRATPISGVRIMTPAPGTRVARPSQPPPPREQPEPPEIEIEEGRDEDELDIDEPTGERARTPSGGGGGHVLEAIVTETSDQTMTLTIEPDTGGAGDDDEAGDDELDGEITKPQAAAGSGKIPIPARRSRRVSDNWDD